MYMVQMLMAYEVHIYYQHEVHEVTPSQPARARSGQLTQLTMCTCVILFLRGLVATFPGLHQLPECSVETIMITALTKDLREFALPRCLYCGTPAASRPGTRRPLRRSPCMQQWSIRRRGQMWTRFMSIPKQTRVYITANDCLL